MSPLIREFFGFIVSQLGVFVYNIVFIKFNKLRKILPKGVKLWKSLSNMLMTLQVKIMLTKTRYFSLRERKKQGNGKE